MPKKKRESSEAGFVKDFTNVAAHLRCGVFIIPDPQGINAENRYYNREKKRPFDFVLVTPQKVFCIEAKYQYNKQEDHQVTTEQKMRQINPGAYWVIRKKVLTRETVYSVEKLGDVIQRFDNLIDLVKYFNP